MRLLTISTVAAHIDENLNDLRDFNSQNVRLSLQRARDEKEVKAVKAYYGLQ